MRRKLRWILMILAGIYVMSLIAASLVIIFFFPEMLWFGADVQSDATTEFSPWTPT